MMMPEYNKIKCSVTVGETTQEFMVPANLLSSIMQDKWQDHADRLAAQQFVVAYAREMERRKSAGVPDMEGTD
jgi:hypothetical protein